MNVNNSLTDVANAALSDLGQPPVASIDSNDATARYCRLNLERIIGQEQQRFDWNELRSTKAMVRLADDTANGIQASEGLFSYLPPGDVLQARDYSVQPVKFRDGRLLSGSPMLSMTYTRFSLVPSEWSRELFRVIVCALAACVCKLVTGDQKLADYHAARLDKIERPDAYKAQRDALGPTNYRDRESTYLDACRR